MPELFCKTKVIEVMKLSTTTSCNSRLEPQRNGLELITLVCSYDPCMVYMYIYLLYLYQSHGSYGFAFRAVFCSRVPGLHFLRYTQLADSWPQTNLKGERLEITWLVVEPTHLKNMLVKLDHFPE